MSELFEIDIHSSLKSYSVAIGSGIAPAALKDDGAIVVMDDALEAFFPWLGNARSIRIPAREASKTLETAATVIERMRDLGANRQSRLVAVGGGIIQDVATFAASSYMRGIEWSYCPTTLLGMVDSCIGGKSSLNVGPYKNIAGNFFPPGRVLIDTEFCTSLPKIQKIEGLLEAVKICYASQGTEFEKYLHLAGTGELIPNTATLGHIIALSLETKKRFIEEDEFDNGVRLLLNFGHTFGHAIEGASEYRISHGVAVGLGMLSAVSFSEEFDLVDRSLPRIAALVKYVNRLLAHIPDLAKTLEEISPVQTMERFRSDKKHRRDEFAVIIFDKDGLLERRFVPASTENSNRIIRVFENLRRELYEIQ